ncbi:flavin monoamine oxidase family protein [Ketogulonicigenium vulgare]|uniref:flavin monoamine oxidase family protein n=1 Tax=Ketogulonicigenium vulgare TaxID=92945 RepID=UPI002359FBA6|nr:flavin monoamine oxidase family protein [Ketogulonicigenium vulgare]
MDERSAQQVAQTADTLPTRRQFLTMVGALGGAAVMYQVMGMMGMAHASPYAGKIDLGSAPPNTKVLVLGAGIAGMVAAMELRDAGYEVEVIEFRDVAGGRCWTLRAGDTYEELGGFVQTVDFAEGNYFNPGPWRVPYNHYGILDYCRRLGVEMEALIQINNNSYLHSATKFDGKPIRYREINSDFRGHISDLLSKVTNQGLLDEVLSDADKTNLLAGLRTFGGLDADNAYLKSNNASARRGYERAPGGGVDGAPIANDPIALSTLLDSGLWRSLATSEALNGSMPIFQPKGGMDMIARAMAANLGDLVKYNKRVIRINQDDSQVTVTYQDMDNGGAEVTTTAPYCVCTIPFSILSKIEHDFSDPLWEVIDSMYYASSIKVGIEFKRRFWEEDEHIYGGTTYTDLPIAQISYPSNDYLSNKPGVLLAAYAWGATAYQFSSMAPEERIQRTLDFGAQIHPQMHDEFKAGVAVAWHRVPWTHGCYGQWRDKEAQYQDAVAMDRRVVMAGEHLSYLPAWMEGAVLSSLDAITRLHAVATANAGEQ